MAISRERKVIIFSEPLHVNKIVTFCRKGDVIIIAFSVEGKVALEGKGIKCYFPDNLIGLPNLNQIGIDNLKRIKKICLFLDEKIKEKSIFLRENNINIFLASFFWIKVFSDSLYTSYSILEKLFDEIGDKEVIVFKKTFSHNKVFIGEDNLIPPLIEDVFSKRHKNIKILHTNEYKFTFPPLKKNLRVFLGNVKRFLPSTIFKGSNFKSNCIVIDNRYDIKYVISDILKDVKFYKLVVNDYLAAFNSVNSCDLYIKKVPVGKNKYDELIVNFFSEIMDDPLYQDLFDDNKALFYFWNKCLKEYLLESLGSLLSCGSHIKDTLINLSPDILITASCRLYLKEAFGLEIARSLRIPIVDYQEGGGAGYLDWPLFNPDAELSDYFVVYGKGVKESPFIKQDKAEVIPAGSIYLENLKKHIKKQSGLQKSICVVLDNLKTTPFQHYPYNGGFFSQAYKHQVNILNSLKQFKNIFFVAKTMKKNEFFYNSFIDGRFVRIETKPLSIVLNDASAFILDYPSTVLLECLTTDKPIALLYNNSEVKFEENAMKLLSRRVRMSSNPEEFPEIIKLLINDIKYGSEMTEDNEFRDRYCLMNNTEKNLKLFFGELLKRDKEVKC